MRVSVCHVISSKQSERRQSGNCSIACWSVIRGSLEFLDNHVVVFHKDCYVLLDHEGKIRSLALRLSITVYLWVLDNEITGLKWTYITVLLWRSVMMVYHYKILYCIVLEWPDTCQITYYQVMQNLRHQIKHFSIFLFLTLFCINPCIPSLSPRLKRELIILWKTQWTNVSRPWIWLEMTSGGRKIDPITIWSMTSGCPAAWHFVNSLQPRGET